jgi:hypothetical protein
MALNENAFTKDLEDLFDSMGGGGGMSTHDYAVALSKVITGYIKTAEIPAGAVITSVAGNASGIPNSAGIKVV